MNEIHIKRRQTITNTMGNETIAFVFAGDLIKRSADSHYLFDVSKNFYYLTGIDEPQAVLVMIKRNDEVKEMLFVRDIDPVMEKWNGKYITKKQATDISGIEMVSYLSSFQSTIDRLLSRNILTKAYVDNERLTTHDITSESERFAKTLSKKWLMSVENLYPMIAAERTIKDEHEIEKIKNAIALTNKAFLHMLANTTSQIPEYRLQAEFEYILKRHDAKPAFDMIVAASERACVLHYVTNREMIEPNTLILTDMGAQLDHYNSDITRTFPSDGVFSKRQRELMDVVLEAMECVFAQCKPGVTLAELNKIVIDLYQQRLKQLQIIDQDHEVSQYYYHGVSHFLGLDVHDVGQLENMKLRSGHVITVEPGLYIEKEKIGIRIEDNVLITQDGYVNLSKEIIKTPDEIEAFMKQQNTDQ